MFDLHVRRICTISSAKYSLENAHDVGGGPQGFDHTALIRAFSKHSILLFTQNRSTEGDGIILERTKDG